MSCDTITPISAFQSTNLNSKIDSFHRLGERIVRSLGAPLVSVEVSQDQLYENISIACEMFSKFAGFSKDYLIFDSSLYERGRGIRIDTLYTLANNLLTLEEKLKHKTESVSTATYLSKPDSVYIVSCPISKLLISSLSSVSSISPNGLFKNQILDKSTYSLLVSSIQLPAYFAYTPSIYTTLTAYHTTQNPIPSSVFAASSSLSSKYSSGIAYNIDILDSTDYSQITSYRTSYNINNFFKSELTTYDTGSALVLNDIPASVFSNNNVLSSTINKKLSVNELISDSSYSSILSNLTSIPVNNYFDTSILSTYSITLELSSNAWQNYPLLSSYSDSQINDLITKQVIDTVESSIGLGFPLSSFVQNPRSVLDGTTTTNVVTSYYTINEIPSSVFLSNQALSAIYPNGLSAQSLLTNNEYNTLISNQNKIGLHNFYSNRNTSEDNNILSAANLYYEKLISNLSNAITAASALVDYCLNNSVGVSFTFSDYFLNENAFTQNIFESHQISISGNAYELFNYDGVSPIGYTYQLSYDGSPTNIQRANYSTYNLDTCYDYNNGSNLLSGIGDTNGEIAVNDFWTLSGANIINIIKNERNLLLIDQKNLSGNYSNFIITTALTGTLFNQFSSLSADYNTNGLSAGSIGNYDLSSNLSSFYVKVISFDAGGFDSNSFFSLNLSSYQTDNYVTLYDVVNGISSKLLLKNPNLSAQFGSGITRGTILSASEVNLLSTYQPNIPFTNNYDLSSTTILKTCNTNVLSNILSPYQTLSSTYSSGLSVGLVLYPSEYTQIQNETNGYFNLNLFFNNVSSTRYVFTNTNVLCANMFSNSTVLSSVYPNGINLNRTMLANEYNILSSNFDSSINNFHKQTIKTTLHNDPYYTSLEHIPSSIFEMTVLSSSYANGIDSNTVLNGAVYNILNSIIRDPLANYFCESRVDGVSNSCESHCSSDSKIFNNMFDYDIMDYRKVIAITDFEEGTSAGLNTLFTIEQTLAQQTYFSYAMGNYGFDLISWWTVKNWLETREKVLALRRSYEFDERTQYLRLYPEPSNAVRFYGIFPAYVERPLRDIIKELWVYKYALALTKISVAMVRGKLGSTTVLGGQIFSQDLLQQGITERDALEQQLYTTSAGLGDSDPVTFFIG